MPKLIAQNEKIKLNGDVSVGHYYAQVVALTTKEQATEKSVPPGVENTPLTWLFSPFFIYGVVILFFALFLGALVVQIVHRSLDMRRTLTSLVLAFVVASVPLTLKIALQVTSLKTRAGPDEVPRQLKIADTGSGSVTVTWDTEAPKTGSIQFGPAPLDHKGLVLIADGGRRTTKHKVILENLAVGITYELEILSGKEWYNDNGKPIHFTVSGP